MYKPLDCENMRTETKAEDNRPRPPSPHFRTTAGFVGLQFIFTTMVSHGVTHFQDLHFSQAEIAITILMGPVAGATFQPYFGTWSDQITTSWGKRKPFIIVGATFMVGSILTTAWADEISTLLAGSISMTAHRAVVVVLSACATFVFWTSAQAVQIGLRALISDHCAASEHGRGSAWAGSYSNLAAVLGNLSACINDRYNSGHSGFKGMSLLAAFLLTTTTLISCFTTQAQAQPRKVSIPTSLWSTGKFLLHRSSQIRNICIVQFFAWGSWFPFLYYVKIYINNLHISELRTGPSGPAANDLGPDMGSATLLSYSMVALCLGVLLPIIVPKVKVIGICSLWKVSLGLLSFTMLSTFLISSAVGSLAIFGVVGLSSAVSSWIPYALLGTESSRLAQMYERRVKDGGDIDETGNEANLEDEDNMSTGLVQSGMIYGLHNFFICLPQILISLGIGIMSCIFDGTDREDTEASTFNPVWVLRLGGALALVATYVARWVKEPLEPRDSTNTVELDEYEV